MKYWELKRGEDEILRDLEALRSKNLIDVIAEEKYEFEIKE